MARPQPFGCSLVLRHCLALRQLLTPVRTLTTARNARSTCSRCIVGPARWRRIPVKGRAQHTQKGRLETLGKSGQFPVRRSGFMPLCGGTARTVSQSDVFKDFYG
jgi:hypothetical protein